MNRRVRTRTHGNPGEILGGMVGIATFSIYDTDIHEAPHDEGE